ncbi:MAG: hypothetical protein Q8K36_02155, partial [Alphaproteobacteria bacterium]|nr:hypothetical protein [Alphaproteobacteria bacterium]
MKQRFLILLSINALASYVIASTSANISIESNAPTENIDKAPVATFNYSIWEKFHRTHLEIFMQLVAFRNDSVEQNNWPEILLERIKEETSVSDFSDQEKRQKLETVQKSLSELSDAFRKEVAEEALRRNEDLKEEMQKAIS